MKERRPDETRLDVAALLEHREWLQRLASHLVAPVGAAEDALQDTWLLALRHPPGNLAKARSWLARVLSNALRRRLRGDRRRKQREQTVAEWRGRVEEPAAAGLEQLQLQQRLIALVDALEEPYRSTVVMRYFEDRSGADIARAMAVPEGTVRWRTHEALSRLRRALDDQAGGDRRAWMAPLGTLVASVSGARGGGPLVWLTGASLALVLAGAAVILRPALRASGTVPDVHPGVERASQNDPRSGSPGRVGRPASPPVMVAAALALAARRLPPAEALAQARVSWTNACPEKQVDGLCATATPANGPICAQAALAGPRLAALPRRQAEREQAISLWTDLSAKQSLPYEIRIQAELALAEDKLEALLSIEPLWGIMLLPHTQAGFEDAHRRLKDFMSRVGQTTREAAWAFERLSGASDEFPEVHMACARLGQTYAEAARLKLAMQIPEGLPTLNRWGKDEQAAFCRSISQNADRLFQKARRQFRYCADRAQTSNPGAASLCERELARLPPEPSLSD